ncbi:MAG: hypothetical protein FWG80_01355 [Alphaproteobacteria bacterium]|nr:hypothetical protein [Alphaproteobacteria bacterium]
MNYNYDTTEHKTNRLCEQNRERPFHEYVNKLLLSSYPTAGSDVLLIGGGESPLYFTHQILQKYNFTNIDLHPGYYPSPVKTINDDFVTYRGFSAETFDEGLALYSLPMYAINAAAAKLFYLRAMLYLKPGGRLRINGCQGREIEQYRTKKLINFQNFNMIRPECIRIIDELQADGMKRITAIYDMTFGGEEIYGIFEKPKESAIEFNSKIDNKIHEIMSRNPDFSFQIEAHDIFVTNYNQR